MGTGAKIAIGCLGAYAAVAVYAYATGKFQVGPSMKPSDPRHNTWEAERMKRAAKWPLSLLPSLSVGG